MSHFEAQSINTPGVAIRALLVGAWALKGYTDIQYGAPAAQPFGAKPAGLLIYTSDGFVSAQLMQPERQSSHSPLWSGWSREEFAAFGRGYIGYCGRYEVDEKYGTVTHLPSVAFLPNLIGQRLLRQVSVTGNHLILKTSYTLIDGSNATSLLEWSRISSNHV